eukprot:CAMPEP_0180543750 /NCGR_PEP_ID=MMETSP1036_2-20121128/69140_1 /TAXON_ID=632150 /ORGANISM="Azadinium spinosum, Strain 3D9" /LENGTH=42 /DNA_ID= /DNA_START= /DNA_END= /DNA_ORIENTATION=
MPAPVSGAALSTAATADAAASSAIAEHEGLAIDRPVQRRGEP